MDKLPEHRSEAERTRVRQGWALIALNCLTLAAVLLTHFDVI